MSTYSHSRAGRESTSAASSTSKASNSGESFESEDYHEDWSKTTHEKDSWANRERRRSNKFSKIDRDIAIQDYERKVRSREGRRGSSVLGIFRPGVDKDGNPLILSDDHHDEDVEIKLDEDGKVLPLSPSITIAFAKPDERRLSLLSENSDKRRGSVLSLWKAGKDSRGKDQIHSGHGDGEDDDHDWEVLTDDDASSPASPRLDDRGVFHEIAIGEPVEPVVLEASPRLDDRGVFHELAIGEPLEQVLSTTSDDKGPQERERHGSILSIWSNRKSRDGKNVILSGFEPDLAVEEPTPDEKVVIPAKRGHEKTGSILSMWSDEKSGFDEDRKGKKV